MKMVHTLAFLLLIIGGLNWGAEGIFNKGIADLFAEGSMIVKIVYILVGLAAVVEVFTHKSSCKSCDHGAASAPRV